MLKDDKFWGIVIYDILEDGCLNGIWTNTSNKDKISNEIARKISCKEKLDGDYTVCWIEPNNEINEGKLIIGKSDSLYYALTWRYKDKSEYTGKGFRMNNKLVVTYWKTE